MSFDPNLLSKLLNQLTKMISAREGLAKWLKDFIDDVRRQEIAINTTKTTAGVVGAVSAIASFTPFAPLAIPGLVAAGGAGVATALGDFIANKVKGDNLEGKVNEMKKDDTELGKLQKCLDEQAKSLAKEMNVSREDAVLFVLVGIPKVLAQTGVQVVKGSVEMVRVLPHLKAISEAMRFGASFSQAVKLASTANTVTQGARASAQLAGGAGRVGTTLAVTTATKALGGLGAVIGIADAVYSWMNANPNRASAEELLPKLEGNIKDLRKYKNQLLELKEAK